MAAEGAGDADGVAQGRDVTVDEVEVSRQPRREVKCGLYSPSLAVRCLLKDAASLPRVRVRVRVKVRVKVRVSRLSPCEVRVRVRVRVSRLSPCEVRVRVRVRVRVSRLSPCEVRVRGER